MVDFFDFDCREFEFWDFVIGVDSGVGEYVGGGFDIGEGYKDYVFGNCVVCMCYDFDGFVVGGEV